VDQPVVKPTSYFDRIFNRPRTIWSIILVGIAVLLLPFIAAYLDNTWDEFIKAGVWRKVLSPPVIALYIWIVSPMIARAGNDVICTLEPLVDLDPREFEVEISTAERINPLHELVAISLGLLLGIAYTYSSWGDLEFSWLKTYWVVSTCAMYGILAWTIFVAASSTRVNAALHRFPMKIDILNPAPFESVGRQSLLLAVVFIGGITLSLVFTYEPSQLADLDFWISNLVLVIFTFSIFFISMRPTHQILAAKKKQTLEPVTERINQSCQDLQAQLDNGKNPGDLPSQISALVAYEQRLSAARTWPYNVTTLRTLFFSVLIPLLSVLARIAVDLFFP
jgi:hypothetical protein